jgi:hypothetical protein
MMVARDETQQQQIESERRIFREKNQHFKQVAIISPIVLRSFSSLEFIIK